MQMGPSVGQVLSLTSDLTVELPMVAVKCSWRACESTPRIIQVLYRQYKLNAATLRVSWSSQVQGRGP